MNATTITPDLTRSICCKESVSRPGHSGPWFCDNCGGEAFGSEARRTRALKDNAPMAPVPAPLVGPFTLTARGMARIMEATGETAESVTAAAQAQGWTVADDHSAVVDAEGGLWAWTDSGFPDAGFRLWLPAQGRFSVAHGEKTRADVIRHWGESVHR